MADAEPAMEPGAEPQAEPKPAPASGPLDGLMSMAIEGVATYAAGAVRDGLSRLVSGNAGAKGVEERPGGVTPSLLLAVAVAAIVTVLLVGRKSAGDPPSPVN